MPVRASVVKYKRKLGRKPSAPVKNWVRFFDAVDDARRTKTFTSLHKIYKKSKITRERVLVVATVRYLSYEMKLAPPKFATQWITLEYPYFVAGVDNLMAMAILESPREFRECNIFVLKNFLDRV